MTVSTDVSFSSTVTKSDNVIVGASLISLMVTLKLCAKVDPDPSVVLTVTAYVLLVS